MKLFALNLVLALVWAALQGSFAPADLALGFAVAFASLWLARPLLGSTRYFSRWWRAPRFLAFLARELVVSNLRVAADVLSPRPRRRPGVVAVPLDAASDLEIALVANLITLTPGSICLDISEDRRTLYVHAMFVDTADGVRAEIKGGMERRVLEVLR